MKFTLAWLKDYLETTATLDEIVDGLFGIGLEVEEVEDKSKALSPFKVAYVADASKHPNADKLRLCMVETDQGLIQVVCGAPNARTGMKGIIALPGAYIPGTKITLEKGVIRGVESQGMLCSERELLISDEHDGIINLTEDWPVGTPAATALHLDDPMIYVKVTANRPDALGVYGIARDLAAKGLGKLKPLEASAVNGTYDSPIKVSLDLGSDTKACPLFVGRHFKNIKNGPSPAWLKRRLTAIGLRPISKLVDITNYITFAYGRPLHVFDASKVKGSIRARMAKQDEEIATLDGKTHQLDPSITVIADDTGAEGIAGIVGGIHSSCTDDTTEVMLEAAYFDPVRTAASGRKLGVNSDARYRFERGIDPAFTPTGAEIATRMILDLCGGDTSKLVVAGRIPDTTRSHTLRKTRVKALGGIDIPWAEQLGILRSLGFGATEAAGGASCKVPSWRPDVQGEADLVEEICRIYGLDKIPATAMPRNSAVTRPVLNSSQKRMIAARRVLASRGLNEAVTWSFLAEREAKLFGGQRNPALVLANPISSELTDMRPSLIANLAAAAGRNQARGFQNLGLFEVGQAYSGDQPEDETLRAGGVRQGASSERHWSQKPRSVDAFDAKADVLAVLDSLGIAANSVQVVPGGPAWLHPGRCGTIQMGPQNRFAVFGEIHPRVLAEMGVKGPMVAFEVILNAVPASKSKGATRAALNASDLMPLTRDFAFVVDSKVEAEKIIKAARNADKMLIGDVRVFDVFGLDDGKKSIAIEVAIVPREKTLMEEDIDSLSSRIVAQVQKATGGTLRS